MGVALKPKKAFKAVAAPLEEGSSRFSEKPADDDDHQGTDGLQNLKMLGEDVHKHARKNQEI